MTGPRPDADLDQALGLDQLPPARITDDHIERAARLAGEWEMAGADDDDLTERIAQAIAEAEKRGAARVIAEHEAAGT